MQQCLQRSCVNRGTYNGEPVREMNRYGLRNYSNDPIPDPSATCPGNKRASIPGNSGQIVGFNSGDEYIRPTFQTASLSTESEGEEVASNNGIVGAAGSIPNVAHRLLPVGSSGSNTIPKSALLPVFNNRNSMCYTG